MRHNLLHEVTSFFVDGAIIYQYLIDFAAKKIPYCAVDALAFLINQKRRTTFSGRTLYRAP